MKFTKMQGCGNDYVYVNGMEEKIPPEKKPELVRRLSDRHFGIGGDGVILSMHLFMLILRWRCTMQMEQERRCVEMAFAALPNMCMIII